MKFNIVTLYPDFYSNIFSFGVINRALIQNKIDIDIYNLRDFAEDKRGSVDDTPFGGGAGMILRADILYKAINYIQEKGQTFSIMLSASGEKFNQKKAYKLSEKKNITIICSKFEGFDERILKYTDLELSIGDYVLSSGEYAALCLLDSIVRLIPGVLGNKESLLEESFSDPNMLEYPQYTRPKNFMGDTVPEILISGDHKKVSEYRKKQALDKTRKNRADLLL
jgi:tRNA (guanine37-N1)-methyltransferase